MMSAFRSADPLGPRMDPWQAVGESIWVQKAKRRVFVTNPASDVNFDRFNPLGDPCEDASQLYYGTSGD
jgi:hypothetical protein